MPDAVGFKNGELVLFEFERQHHAQLARKKLKYKAATWLDAFPHRVEWVDAAPRRERARQAYGDGPEGFVGVAVLEKVVERRGVRRVHNLEVKDDHSYVCQNVVVHNCFEKQTNFMARHGLAAHVGGWIFEVVVGDGYKVFRQEFIPFYI
jgi:hypothetical protein